MNPLSVTVAVGLCRLEVPFSIVTFSIVLLLIGGCADSIETDAVTSEIADTTDTIETTQRSDVSIGDTTALHAAVREKYVTDQADSSVTTFRSAFLDLNGDGRDEGLVYQQGMYYCGNGGCSLWVFEAGDQGFTLDSDVVHHLDVMSAFRPAGDSLNSLCIACLFEQTGHSLSSSPRS